MRVLRVIFLLFNKRIGHRQLDTHVQEAQLSQRGRAMLHVCSHLQHTYSAVFYY